MLAPDLALTDIDGRHWANWYDLLVPPGVLDRPRWALVLLESSSPVRVARVIVAGDGARGALDPGEVELTSLEHRHLAGLARTLAVGAVIAIEVDAFARLSAEVERQLSLDQDLVAQGLVVLRALKRLSGRGVWTEPHLLELLPAPAFEPLQRTFDLLIPDGSALVAYVIDDDRRAVHASIIAVKRGGDITAAATHAAIAGTVSEAALARDWRKHYKRVVAAVEERFAKPSVALFLERDTLLRVITGPSDQLARELNAKNVIIDPAPAWLLGLLGGATVAAFASRGARALASMLPQA
ncbi:MAG: hypothetical protein KC464_21675, partial [Myxococcales bacterium]|nr:hypothetical protein [Myxococcales bacterium]